MHEAGESKFSYKWTFPDGGTSDREESGARVQAGVIFAGTVTLIVSRTPHGSQTRNVNTPHGDVATDLQRVGARRAQP